jgi:sugar phosphate isomerase/epimerase
LRECAGAAEDHGVTIGLEGHQLVTVRSAEVARDVVDAVASPWVRVDFDPVNWLTLETVYDSGAEIERMLATLGDRVVSAHVKDIRIEDRHVVHLEQCVAGTGLLDLGSLLRGMERIDPDAAVIVEGAGAHELPAVVAHLERVAATVGAVIRH